MNWTQIAIPLATLLVGFYLGIKLGVKIGIKHAVKMVDDMVINRQISVTAGKNYEDLKEFASETINWAGTEVTLPAPDLQESLGRKSQQNVIVQPPAASQRGSLQGEGGDK